MATLTYTVLGASGFIGGALVSHLKAIGHRVAAPQRTDLQISELRGRDLGHLIYCIGLTADFRTKPFATVEAHVSFLARVLELCRFDTLTYLSSTRVYAGAMHTREDAAMRVDPGVPGDLYNISKLMGESLCLSSGRNCRIVRLSNVFGLGSGVDNFLGSVVQDAATHRRVVFRATPDSEKDYVSVADVVRWLSLVGQEGSESIYNLAFGRNTSNRALAARLTAMGIACSFARDASTVSFLPIDTTRISSAFGSASFAIEDELPKLVDAARNR